MFKSRISLFVFSLGFLIIPVWTYAEPPSGVAVLRSSSSTMLNTVVPANTRPLVTPIEQETFLMELEGTPPKWDTLHNQPGEEHGERLFALNRSHDEKRIDHPLLKQRLAFLWSGILRNFDSEHQGYTVAMGPELTPTTWGIIRFKPVGLPNYMIAIPSKNLLPRLKTKVSTGEQVEISILFIGTLVPNESIMYGFSHDIQEKGMIMPFVQIEEVQYHLLK